MLRSLMTLVRKVIFIASVLLLIGVYAEKHLPDGLRFLRVVSDQATTIPVGNNTTFDGHGR
ncbi:MAG: hypothetical protein HQL77_18925 [Magnetococcales bacterium]|nr:hypothetical protein [Magnetococcales bacterium]